MKRFFLILSLSLFAAMFTGCDGDDTDTDDASAQNGDENGSSAEAKQPPLPTLVSVKSALSKANELNAKFPDCKYKIETWTDKKPDSITEDQIEGLVKEAQDKGFAYKAGKCSAPDIGSQNCHNSIKALCATG